MNTNLKDAARDIRCDTLRCIGHLGVGHIGGCLSVAELLAVLYFEAMNIDPAQPKCRAETASSALKAMPALLFTLRLQTAGILTGASY